MQRLLKGAGIRQRENITWCDYEGRPSALATQRPLDSIMGVESGTFKASAKDVFFRDTDYFVAAELRNLYDVWDYILQGYYKRDEILKYIKHGVSVHDIFQPFKGEFKGKFYDSPSPPKIFLENNKICSQFEEFISSTILERVQNGSLSIWGKEGECNPPHLVMPITIEPSKPRMCHDERFLNLWMNTPSVTFDHITDIPRYVDKGHFQSKLDDKSGYDHIALTEDSRTYFGLFWKGWFLVYNVLPFGWSPSAYVYHTTGMGPSNFIRSNGVPLSQYIDDRHIGQLRLLRGLSSEWSNLDLANAALFITALVLVNCGYFIGLNKSVLLPVQEIPFLGFISDSVNQAFSLPDEKKVKFASLRESLLNSKFIPVKSLQRFAGKAVSFSLAVPASRLFTREINWHISKGIKNSRPVRLSSSLKEELLSWRFLDAWEGFLPWKEEKHFSIKVITDASNSGWGGILSLPSSSRETKDYWCNEVFYGSDISIKEAKALYNTLATFANEVFNGRVNAYVDNTNLVDFWNNQGGRNIELSNEIKDLFCLSLKLNILLKLHFVPSESNLADAPSRFYSDSDCTLSPSVWSLVEVTFGPHTFDLMAIPSNVMKDKFCHQLKFFSPFPVAGSAGVDIFAQVLAPDENYYVFPPFVLVGPLIKFLQSQSARVTIVIPDISPRKYWWPLVNSMCIVRLKIANKKDLGALLFPPSTKVGWHTRPLPWDLYAFRINF